MNEKFWNKVKVEGGYAETDDGYPCCICCGLAGPSPCAECVEHQPKSCGCTPCSKVEDCEDHKVSLLLNTYVKMLNDIEAIYSSPAKYSLMEMSEPVLLSSPDIYCDYDEMTFLGASMERARQMTEEEQKLS